MLFPLYNDFRDTSQAVTSPEDRERLGQVLDCRTVRGLDACSPCSQYDECDLVKTYLRQRVFPSLPSEDGEKR